MTQEERINKIIELLNKYHHPKTYRKDIKVFGYQYNYFTTLNGDVSDYYFGRLDITKYLCPLNEESSNTNRPGTIRDDTLYICVHDTASVAQSAGALSHAKYVYNGGGGTSWHYSCGDDAIYQQLPDDEVGYHAGDGLVIKHELFNTGVCASTNDPFIEIIDGYYYFNGQKSIIKAPTLTTKIVNDVEYYASGDVLQGRVLDNEKKIKDLNYVIDTKSINKHGIYTKIIDGYYYIGPTYFNNTYKLVCNRLGNLYSVGIEMMINQGSNLLLTYHKCAKLVASLLHKYNLDPRSCKPHHYFSGKNCPMTIFNNNLWHQFKRYVEAEYEISSLLGDDITLNYCDNVNSYGVLLNNDLKEISYDVSIKSSNFEHIISFKTQII